ncbi:hypothetical protein LSTR_LSTR009498 [Laodelphax striatellus]|uniref:Uncharacterized protein n=1 Tax=Laodelphax striatellus TaxID=195883 RepID=A0A482WF75_LAOST|nr:hypothetical protein LSTR_LSTR009498 [Laodelphax striatellus]
MVIAANWQIKGVRDVFSSGDVHQCFCCYDNRLTDAPRSMHPPPPSQGSNVGQSERPLVAPPTNHHPPPPHSNAGHASLHDDVTPSQLASFLVITPLKQTKSLLQLSGSMPNNTV